MGADLAIFLYNPNTFQQWKSTTIMYLLLLPFLLNLGPSFSRELRPTQHGLPFQNSLSPQSLNNTSSSSPEMLSFFGYKYSDHNNTKSGSPPDTAWWKQVSDGDGNNKTGKDERVRRGLMIATIVCGGIGIVLLISALLLFVFHFHRYRRSSSSSVTVTNRNLVGIGNAGPSTAAAAPSTAATAAVGYHPISTK